MSYEKYLSVIAYNNGVVGFRNLKFLNEYIEQAKFMNHLINNSILINAKHQTMIFEQYLLYYLSQKHGLNMFEILPEDDIISYGYNETGNKYGYTHLLSGNKFVGSFITLVRNKILRDYSEYKINVEMFEESINNVEFMLLNHLDENKLIKNVVKKW